jgi:hypothetical protein
MNKLRNISRAILTFGLVTVPSVVRAEEKGLGQGLEDIKKVGNAAGIATAKTPMEIVGQILNVALGFLGVVLLAYMLYAGFLWMTSGGDDTKAKQAKTMITNSIIGLVIIVSAFAISNFVLTQLVKVTST